MAVLNLTYLGEVKKSPLVCAVSGTHILDIFFKIFFKVFAVSALFHNQLLFFCTNYISSVEYNNNNNEYILDNVSRI